MKAYTDIEQSKKLAEILPIGSNDMYYEPSVGFNTHPSEVKIGDIKYAHPLSIPCWSLSALLKMFPNGVWYNNDYTVPILLPQIKNKWICRLYNPEKDIDIFYIKDNPIDAVFEMVVWLLENKKI